MWALFPSESFGGILSGNKRRIAMDVLVSNLLMYGKTAEQGVLATLAALEGERKRGRP